MNRLSSALFLFLLATVFSSCTFYKVVSGKRTKDPDKRVDWTGADTSKKVAVDVPVMDTLAPPPVVAKAVNPLIEQLKPVWDRRIDFKTFNGKARMHFTGPDSKVDFTGNFHLRKDSVIWINITALAGLIQVRILITPDSFFMINYQQEQVTKMPIANADKFLPAKVDFKSLQNLIIGEPIRDGVITDAGDLGDSLVLNVEDSSYIQRMVYNKVDSSLRNGHLKTRKPNGPTALTEYDGYSFIGNRRISTNRAITLMNVADEYLLDMNFTKIDFDEDVSFSFNIPAKFTIKN